MLKPLTRIHFLAQLPPPVHGVTQVNAWVYGTLIEAGCTVYKINLGHAAGHKDIGKFRAGKLFGFLKNLLSENRHSDLAYLPFSPRWPTLYRDALAARLTRRFSRRVLIHIHGEGFGQSLNRPFIRFLLKGCEVIAMTQKTCEIAGRSNIFSVVHRLPNAVPMSSVQKKVRTQNLRLLYLANLKPEKGILAFLDVLAALNRENLGFEADVAGEFTRAMTAEALAKEIQKRGLAKLVKVHGAVGGSQKEDLLRRADLFVYPSRHDHVPLVLLEAMSAGVVPLVADTGGMPEILGPDLRSLVFNGNPVAQMSKHIMQLDKDRRQLDQLSGKVRKRVTDHYGFENWQRKLLTIFAATESRPQQKPEIAAVGA